MRAPQLVLDLAPPRRHQFSNFLSDESRPVVETLRIGREAGQWYFLSGPSGTGKSHLAAAVFNQARDADLPGQFLPCRSLAEPQRSALLAAAAEALVVLDDVDALYGDPAGEEALFHALNRWKELGVTVVMTGTGLSGLALPDLKSRLASAIRLTLKPPGDAFRRRLLGHLAEELEVDLRARARDYLLSRGPRNVKAQVEMLEELRGRALAERRGVTVPMVRSLLVARGVIQG